MADYWLSTSLLALSNASTNCLRDSAPLPIRSCWRNKSTARSWCDRSHSEHRRCHSPQSKLSWTLRCIRQKRAEIKNNRHRFIAILWLRAVTINNVKLYDKRYGKWQVWYEMINWYYKWMQTSFNVFQISIWMSRICTDGQTSNQNYICMKHMIRYAHCQKNS